MKYIFTLILLLTIVYHATLIYVEAHIDQKDHSNVYNAKHITWSARGIYDSYATQNSLESFQKAFEAGYVGAEVDCFYDEFLDKFIVSHDRYPNKEGKGYTYNLKNGKLLTLKELFETLGKDHYFWVDYKNLDRLDKATSLKAIQRLDAITKVHHIKERIYLEGSTPNHLQYYADAGYKTLFAFGPLPQSHLFSSISSNFYKIGYYFYDMSAIAIQYGKIDDPKYGKTAQENLKGIPTFLFHVPNETQLLQELATNPDVRVLLVGRDLSVNRADIIRDLKPPHPSK